QITPISNYRKFLEPYWVVGNHENINNIHEIIQTESLSYIFFKKSSEDLHSYIRRRSKLKEDEVCWLFTQIVSAVKHCHDNGVVLRDLKLRKFVFQDSNCTHLLLDNLEDSCILADQNNDLLTDRHGCPAYVSPEILFSVGGYSGKLADVWSLGVIFYTFLAGKYPFHDSDVGALFKKIRQGVYPAPVGATSKSKCLLRNLLRVDSSERMGIDEIFAHPWF
ncbi:hypothetical protein HELRODRAFT_142631, partial [Helobdella robusta]|uniref:Protein kinase domain-containing protein n=1 Tax=Helobdella robusta TaxID=6412 RepID=T1EJ64_HELRO